MTKHFNVNGKFININSESQESLDEALRYANTKHKLFALRGSQEQKQTLAKRAVRLGVDRKVANPELAEFIREERLISHKEELTHRQFYPPQEKEIAQHEIGRDVKTNNLSHEDQRINAEQIDPRVFKRDAEDILLSNFKIPLDMNGRSRVNREEALQRYLERLEGFAKDTLVAGAEELSKRTQIQIAMESLDQIQIKQLSRKEYLLEFSKLQVKLAEHDLHYRSSFSTTAPERLSNFSKQVKDLEQATVVKGQEQTIEKKPQDISQSTSQTNPFLFHETLTAGQKDRYKEFEETVKRELRLRNGGRDVLMFREQQLLNEEFIKREQQNKSEIGIKPEKKEAKLENSQSQEAITLQAKVIGESDIFRGLKIGAKEIKVVNRDEMKLEEDLQQQL